MLSLMDNYASSDESEKDESAPADPNGAKKVPPPAPSTAVVPAAPTTSTAILAAPEVDLSMTTIKPYLDPQTRVLTTNPPVEYFEAPIKGPLAVGKSRADAFSGKDPTNFAGQREKLSIDQHTFEEQYNTFNSFGYAMDPGAATGSSGTNRYVGSAAKFRDMQGATVSSLSIKQQRGLKRKRKVRDDPGEQAQDGYDWFESMMEKGRRKDEDEEELERREELPAEKKARTTKAQQGIESSEFNGESQHDYQGRTYMHCPAEYRAAAMEDKRCYIPKTWVHTWTGHKKGVNAIKFFPGTGHLLLSCSMDSTCKLWDVNGKRELLRTYSGHQQAVRQCYFNSDGSRFITSSFDGWVKVWDTEYGKVTSRHTSGHMPFDAKFYPRDENQFLCGQKNKMAVQWDARADEIVQTYKEHLSAVNTVTFVGNAARFVTTSDDKAMFVWDYGVPVVIKHIRDPSMHSVPYVGVSPNGKWFAGQSLDNRIVVYSAQGRFKQNAKKHFKGHLNAGYACGVNFSADGRFLMSGDASGRCFFWDWKTSKIYRRLHCHDKVTMDCQWHPVLPSKVATCSWDGTIKYWD